MIEKTNSAETISHHFLSKKCDEPTFSEVPDTKNINETDKEAEHRSIAGLVLMLAKYVRLMSISLSTSA
jgi:hypothetical protein